MIINSLKQLIIILVIAGIILMLIAFFFRLGLVNPVFEIPNAFIKTYGG